MDTSQSPQEMVMEQKEEKIPANNVDCTINPLERIQRPQKDQALSCPRCNSTNTKFCYYNNYSLTLPRYFCKTCRRYWTEGGSLRNIPVGGGSRKNKRSSTNSSIASSKNEIKNPHDPSMFLPPPIISQNHNNKIQESPDLNFGFSREHGFKSLPELFQSPHFDHGITPTSSRGFSLFNPIIAPEVSDRNNVYSSSSSGFSMPIELKPSLEFSLYGLGTNNNNNGFSGSLQNVEQDGGNGRFLFPFEDLRLKQATTTPTASTAPTTPTDHHQLQQNKELVNEENSSGDIEMEY